MSSGPIRSILLLNSDLASNRGDRAIAEGNIMLLKKRYPGASITGISEQPIRDKEWFNIDFADMNFQSLSPIDMLRLIKLCRGMDLIVWGGGEILKDYTNKSALWYWALKIYILSKFNKNLYGLFQGIGPTRSKGSKKLISFVVNRCTKGFILRDKESRDKLVKWGVDAGRLDWAPDPAILPATKKPSNSETKRVATIAGLEVSYLKDSVIIGIRDWFHYSTSGIIPFKYKKKLGLAKTNRLNHNHETYINNLVKVVETITNKGTNVIFLPMHIQENDLEIANQICLRSEKRDMIRIIKNDDLSPKDLRLLVASVKACIGIRLHSTIISTSCLIPSINIYYVDKGRQYFEQIDQSKLSMPIEDMLLGDFDTKFKLAYNEIVSNGSQISSQLDTTMKAKRKAIMNATKLLPQQE